jgi:hypothetical protein
MLLSLSYSHFLNHCFFDNPPVPFLLPLRILSRPTPASTGTR